MWLLMPSVRREVVLPVEPERAWELITDPAELEGWLADEVELEPEEGGDGPRRVRGRRAARGLGRGGRARGRRLVFVWGERASRVEWTLDARRPAAPASWSSSAASRPSSGPRMAALAAHGLAVPGLSEPELGALFAALADPTRRQVIRSLRARAGVTASGARRRAADHPPGDRQAPRRARARRPRGAAPRGARDALPLDAGAARRRDRLDGGGRRALGPLARAAQRAGAAA